MPHLRKLRRDDQDFDTTPVDSRGFWHRANLTCSQRELEILTQRAAGMRWEQIAQLHHLSIRQTHRLWTQAIDRTAGRIGAHRERRSNP